MSLSSAQGETLSIGELAQRTGVAPATLRMWEQRHGFPVPMRLASGHRRYRVTDAVLVEEVLRRRDEGVRLDVAIAQATTRLRAEEGPPPASVFAELTRAHPDLAVHRLRKSSLVALCWAIEDEFCAKATRPYLFGAFQRAEFFDHSRPRWRELSRVARAAYVFAELGSIDAEARPVEIDLPADALMRREWVLVCDSPELSAVLSAWELPGQDDVPDRDRAFESVWTVDPSVTRQAAQVCAGMAAAAGAAGAAEVAAELAAAEVSQRPQMAAVTALFNRVVAYGDVASRVG